MSGHSCAAHQLFDALDEAKEYIAYHKNMTQTHTNYKDEGNKNTSSYKQAASLKATNSLNSLHKSIGDQELHNRIRSNFQRHNHKNTSNQHFSSIVQRYKYIQHLMTLTIKTTYFRRVT